MKSIYLGKFKSKEDIERAYEEDLSKINVIFAYYDIECYEGSAWVLIEKENKLYEINSYHCSCYGLEGQWNEEECTIEDLKYRLENGRIGGMEEEEMLILKNCLGVYFEN